MLQILEQHWKVANDDSAFTIGYKVRFVWIYVKVKIGRAERQIRSLYNSVATLGEVFNRELMHLYNPIKRSIGCDIVKTDEAEE